MKMWHEVVVDGYRHFPLRTRQQAVAYAQDWKAQGHAATALQHRAKKAKRP